MKQAEKHGAGQKSHLHTNTKKLFCIFRGIPDYTFSPFEVLSCSSASVSCIRLGLSLFNHPLSASKENMLLFPLSHEASSDPSCF